MAGSLTNLLYTNANPRPETICGMCEPFIGMVFEPDLALPLPAHPGCYCTYFPTDAEPDVFVWGNFSEAARRHWVLYAAWLLRQELPLPLILQELREEAEEYNREREEDDEEGGQGPGTPEPPGPEESGVMGFTHNSKVAKSEPGWGSVDKTRLPNVAFADREERKYPHHWVEGGGDQDDNGRYTSGTMWLHRGGLGDAWGAAHGARSGQDAPAGVITHLQAHRSALGLDDDEGEENAPLRVPAGRVVLRPVGGQSGRREYDCIFMTAGLVKQADQGESNWLITADAIRGATSLFDARPSYLDHPDLFGFGWRGEPQVKNLVGVTFDAHWSDDEKAMLGGLRLYDQEPSSPGGWLGVLMDQILADKSRGLEVPPVGLSASLYQESELDEESGLRVTTAFRYVESVDVVYDPGAGGYIRAALAAVRPQQWRGVTLGAGGVEMPEEEVVIEEGSGEVIATVSGDASEGVERMDRVLRSLGTLEARLVQLESRPEMEPESEPEPVSAVEPLELVPGLLAVDSRIDALTGAVERLVGIVAQQEEDRTITGMGDAPRGRLALGLAGMDQVEAAFDGLLSGVRPPDGVPPLSGIREFYHIMSGDYEMTGLFQPDRVHLANVTSSTMASLVANRLNKRVMVMFAQYPMWWEPFVTIQDFTSLQDVRWITLGGIGELPTVAEGAAYTEMTWDDLTQVDEFVKKGGYLGLTLEAIDKDDVSRLIAAPRAMAQAAWLTLSKAISTIFTYNSGLGPLVYYDDSNTRSLFDASNNNLGTTALSPAAWKATRTAMRQQTELNSGERLGMLTAPKFLLVPNDLEFLAIQILATQQIPGSGDWYINPEAEGDGREARLAAAAKRVIVVDLWTETADWAAVADPLLWPSVGLGFRYGRVPEVFSVADPKAGLMFSNDTMPVKVRFFFATGPIDYRGLYKQNP